MSHFVECQTEFRDPQALVAALVECGFQESQIEVHAEAVPLYGYKGDVRPQRAHIVIRRQHVGPAANDVGWERQPDGTYRAWVSEYDGRHRFDPRVQAASGRSTATKSSGGRRGHWGERSPASGCRMANSGS